MSLINDALRRAKEAQQKTSPPPAPELPFRPVEPAQQCARRGLGLLLPAALAAVALLVLLSAWVWAHPRGTATPIEVNARTAPAPQVTTPGSGRPAQPAPLQAPATAAAPTAPLAPSLAANATSTPADEPLAGSKATEATNAPALTPPAPPKPAPLRLQAIIYNPSRPSAMISGRTLFVGDRVGDLRVVFIDKDSATLVGAGKTNILSLAE
jgi:hypothetical protein